MRRKRIIMYVGTVIELGDSMTVEAERLLGAGGEWLQNMARIVVYKHDSQKRKSVIDIMESLTKNCENYLDDTHGLLVTINLHKKATTDVFCTNNTLRLAQMCDERKIPYNYSRLVDPHYLVMYPGEYRQFIVSSDTLFSKMPAELFAEVKS